MRRLLCTFLLTALTSVVISPTASAVPLGGKNKAPRGLEYVSGDAIAFIHVNLGDLNNNPHFKLIGMPLIKGGRSIMPDFTQKEFGIPMENVVGLTSVLQLRGETTVLVTKKPIDQKTVINTILTRYGGKPVEHRYGGKVIYSRSSDLERGFPQDKPPIGIEDGPGIRKAPPPPGLPPQQPGRGQKLSPYAKTIWLVNPRTIIVGQARAITALIDEQGKEARPGPLAAVLERVGKTKHHLSIGGHLPMKLRDEIERDFRRQANRNALHAALIYNVKPLLEFTSASLTASLGEETRIEIHGEFPNAASATKAKESVRFSLQMLQGMVAFGRSELENEIGIDMDPAKGGKPALLWARLEKTLSNPTIKQEGKTLTVEVKAATEIKLAREALAESLPIIHRRALEVEGTNNLKQIGVAMHNHAADYRNFPLPAWQTAHNRPPVKGAGLSWRVAILPYIEQGNLYNRFKHDEPWDSEHNKKLIPLMPKVFGAPGMDVKKGLTHHRVFTGRMAMFDPMRPTRFSRITDGTSNTFMVVEASEPVIWTKPDELPYDPKMPLPKLGGIAPKKFRVLFGDGSVRTFKTEQLSEKVLRAYITANGGEVIPYDRERDSDDFPRETKPSRGDDPTPAPPAPPLPPTRGEDGR